MNIGELKLQNTFLNSQLQLNNDLLNSKQTSNMSFDDILKRKTISRSVKTDDSFQKQDDFDKTKSNKSTEVHFNNHVGADFSNRGTNEANGLRKQFKNEIAQNKFTVKNDNGRSDDVKNANASSDKNANTIGDIKEKLEALEKKIKDELGIAVNEEPISEEVLSEIAALLGIDVQAVEELIANIDMSEEVDGALITLIENPEVIEALFEKIKSVDNKEVLETFNEVLTKVAGELDGEIKAEIEKLVETVDTKISEMAKINSLKEIPSAEVSTEQVKTSETSTESKTTNSNVEVNAESAKNVEVVDSKGQENSDNSEKQEMSQGEKSKLLSKGETKTETQVVKTLDEQVTIMKDQNTNITSTKIDQPKAVLAKSITNQIVQGAKMSVNLSDVGSEILIKLNPKNLGNVSLKMSFEKGTLLAQINVENQTVKGLVESNLEDLKNALKDEGYMIGELDVSVSKDNSDQQQSFEEQFGSNENDNETFEEVEEKVLKEQQKIVTEDKVDYLA